MGHRTGKRVIFDLGASRSTKDVQLNSGYRIPLVGLGTYKLRDAASMEPAVDNASEAGYRLFDTAKNYRNEAVLGNALKVYSRFMLRNFNDSGLFAATCPQTERHLRNHQVHSCSCTCGGNPLASGGVTGELEDEVRPYLPVLVLRGF